MSTRNIVLVGVIVACVLLAVYIALADPFAPKIKKPEGPPRGTPVVCTNPECFYEGRFTGSIMRTEWPTTCPKCGSKTLLIAQKCPHCGKQTSMAPPDFEGSSIKCIRCGKAIPVYPMQMP